MKPMTDYCYIGGKMVMTAHNLAASPYIPSFMILVPHCQDNRLRRVFTFVGAGGQKGYPDVALDYAKMDTTWHNTGCALGLAYMVAGRPSGFGEIIYDWRDNGCGGGFPFTGTCGVRYVGLTYQVVYFGFPLYYCEKPTVIQMLTKAFQDIGY
jgi:hypothetical protein